MSTLYQTALHTGCYDGYFQSAKMSTGALNSISSKPGASNTNNGFMRLIIQ